MRVRFLTFCCLLCTATCRDSGLADVARPANAPRGKDASCALLKAITGQARDGSQVSPLEGLRRSLRGDDSLPLPVAFIGPEADGGLVDIAGVVGGCLGTRYAVVSLSALTEQPSSSPAVLRSDAFYVEVKVSALAPRGSFEIRAAPTSDARGSAFLGVYKGAFQFVRGDWKAVLDAPDSGPDW